MALVFGQLEDNERLSVTLEHANRSMPLEASLQGLSFAYWRKT